MCDTPKNFIDYNKKDSTLTTVWLYILFIKKKVGLFIFSHTKFNEM